MQEQSEIVMEICKQHSEIEMGHLPAILIYGFMRYTDLGVMGVRVGMEAVYGR